ncbi:MAG TPA: HlyD family efflux transporter periplasmic adaptor subunit, partial [Candidatus Moranbacteria bacterium]|nr:HlyD family efflux transporter periplasmic adaptor subunit [Candidatus Moranbacteria bacterium]
MEQIKSAEFSEKKEPKKMFKRKMDRKIAIGSLILIVAIAIGGYAYWRTTSSRIYIEKGEVSAPQIDLSSQNGGILETLWVKEGDTISRNQPVAQVGDEIIRSREDGLVVKVQNEIGRNFNRGEAIVGIIKPSDLRVLGTIEENKGLSDIQVGQRVIFTADAYGSKEYQGFVDEISPSSKDKGLAFSISDKRATSEFVIKVRFNNEAYPELKNGMSA